MDPNLLILETVYLKIKDRSYAINLNEYESIGTHWIALYVNDMQHTFIASELNIFRKKLKTSLATEI